MEKPNLTYIQELSGGDTNFEARLKGVIKAEFPIELAEYESNMTLSAFAKAAENVHKIKHKLGILGMEKSYELAIRYEEKLREGSLEHQTEFEEVLSVVIDFIKDF